MKIKKLKFKYGGSPSSIPLEIDTKKIIIFVGANNSGKSLALREIESLCCDKRDVKYKIMDEYGIDIDFPKDPEQAWNLLLQFEGKHDGTRGENPPYRYMQQVVFGNRTPQRGGHTEKLFREFYAKAVSDNNIPHLCSELARFCTINLDTVSRITDLIATQPFESTSKNHLASLYTDQNQREYLRELIVSAFKNHFVSYFVIEKNGNDLKIKLSPTKPRNVHEEQSLESISKEFLSKAEYIEILGDGMKAYVGLLSAIVGLPHKIILVDEPECFLASYLQNNLGADIIKASMKKDASLVVSTHSPDFLMGILETSVKDTTILRFDYENSIPTVKSLDPNLLITLVNDPLLRCSDSLDALFHKAAIVSESDADKVFYKEMNRRLAGTPYTRQVV